MRETRNAQASIFDFYSEHEKGRELQRLSALLDEERDLLGLVERDFHCDEVSRTGALGLSIESIFRCLLLKTMTGLSYRALSFVLSDSQSYRSFARLRGGESPSRSALQASVRRVSAETLAAINQRMMSRWVEACGLSLVQVRIDSTVVDSAIAAPSDSQLLNDGVRVLSRLMSKSQSATGVKVRFVDQRARAKSLAFRLFHAKKAEKDRLYPQLLGVVAVTLRQTGKALERVRHEGSDGAQRWMSDVAHYRALLSKVIDQTQRRVFNDERVPVSEKLVSLFEPHTDILVNGRREVRYGHKVNLATQDDGFITYANIEMGNPADNTLYLPVIEACSNDFDCQPMATVADGSYASQANVTAARALGVKRVVFHKRVGLSYHQMGVKKKTFDALKRFRAGIEGNISELKRAFGLARVTWKGLEGFKAYVWSAVLSYNLVRMARFSSA